MDSDTDWFVGYLEMNTKSLEEIANITREWAEHEGIGTRCYVADMNKEGACCEWNSGVCEDCEFCCHMEDGGTLCRLGCSYA